MKSCSKSCKDSKQDNTYDFQDYRSEFIELPYPDKFCKITFEDGVNWYRVTTKREIIEILEMIDNNRYMIVHGNTAKGK